MAIETGLLVPRHSREDNLSFLRVPQRSSNTYSCCASRVINVGLAPGPTTNSEPIKPGTMVIKEIVPSGFLRLATSLFHSPKSKIVEAPDVLTALSPSDGLA